MDPRINILTIFLTMTLVSIAGTLTNLINSGVTICVTTYFFVIFFIVLRLKFYLDDHGDFSNTGSGNIPKLSFVIGSISWFFWLITALNLKYLNNALLFLVIAITIATIALIPLWHRNNRDIKYIKWMLFNFAYISVLLVLRFWSPWSEMQQIGFYSLCILITVLDFYKSRTLDLSANTKNSPDHNGTEVTVKVTVKRNSEKN
jgi:hypothetical protein